MRLELKAVMSMKRMAKVRRAGFWLILKRRDENQSESDIYRKDLMSEAMDWSIIASERTEMVLSS